MTQRHATILPSPLRATLGCALWMSLACSGEQADDESPPSQGTDGGGGHLSGEPMSGGHAHHHDDGGGGSERGGASGSGGSPRSSGGHGAGLGGTSSGGDEGGGGTSSGGAAPVVNGCVSFVDASGSASARELNWNFDLATSPTRCSQIQVGQSVAWSGNFSMHPIEPYGGTAPNPIATNYPEDGPLVVNFPTPGTYGFICAQHIEMQGAIRVEP